MDRCGFITIKKSFTRQIGTCFLNNGYFTTRWTRGQKLQISCWFALVTTIDCSSLPPTMAPPVRWPIHPTRCVFTVGTWRAHLRVTCDQRAPQFWGGAVFSFNVSTSSKKDLISSPHQRSSLSTDGRWWDSRAKSEGNNSMWSFFFFPFLSSRGQIN